MKVTVSGPSLEGDCPLKERREDATLVLRPDTSMAAIRHRVGSRARAVRGALRRPGQPFDEAGLAAATQAALAVRIDTEALDEDLATPQTGRDVGEQAHRGARASLRRAAPGQAEGRDGTNLASWVKAYLPAPDGHWDKVFPADTERRPPGGGLRGLRPAPSDPPLAAQVYQVAHRRLHA